MHCYLVTSFLEENYRNFAKEFFENLQTLMHTRLYFLDTTQYSNTIQRCCLLKTNEFRQKVKNLHLDFPFTTCPPHTFKVNEFYSKKFLMCNVSFIPLWSWKLQLEWFFLIVEFGYIWPPRFQFENTFRKFNLLSNINENLEKIIRWYWYV